MAEGIQPRAGGPLLNLLRMMGAPGLDFQTWETSESGVGEDENPLVEVHRFPHLKSEMWATRRMERIQQRSL
jgi:hypothetical protein